MSCLQKIFLLLLTTTHLACIATPVATPSLKKGMKISAANRLVLREKWIPDPEKSSQDFAKWGLPLILQKKGITSIEDCAMDAALCNFKYKKGKSCLRLTAEGESFERLKIVYWTRDCDING